MSSDVMRVRLHLRGVRVLEVVADSPGRLEVAVEAAWSWSRCPHCGFKCRRVHDRRVKRVWDRPVSGRETVLLWRRRRWRCDNCGERHLEDLVSGGREPPPPALLEPYVTVSRHTAPTVRRGVEATRCQ